MEKKSKPFTKMGLRSQANRSPKEARGRMDKIVRE
jgi:hypothetical protein